MELLELLTAGDVEAFNELRGLRQRLSFFAADLPERNLSGIDLSSVNLDKSDLTSTNFTDATLYRTSMRGVDGTGMVLVRALATRLRLKEAYVDDADFTDADMAQADLKEAVLTGSRGERVRLTGAKLIDADASDVVWPEADLGEAVLHKARFPRADLRQADFTDAQASHVDFSRATLDGIVASRGRFGGAVFVGASLRGARFDGAHLAGADFSGADLSAVDFSGADLTEATFAGAKLHGAVFSDAILDRVDLSGLDVTGVDFTGVDPHALGLSEEQMGAVASVGAAGVEDAEIRVKDGSYARNGERLFVAWIHGDEEDEGRALRFAVIDGGGDAVPGVLPISAEGVINHAAVPDGDGFRVVLLKERPSGVAMVCYPVGADGTVGASVTAPLGYTPAIRPVVRVRGEEVVCWGMARRGPTWIVQRIEGEQVVPLYSQKVATASGFLGRHEPVLFCKGGVVIPLGWEGAGQPFRAPDGFPGRLGSAAVYDERVLAVWVETETEDRPGGIRSTWLQRRGSEERMLLSPASAVSSLDLLSTSDGVWVAWIEDLGEKLEVRVTLLPEGGVVSLPIDPGCRPRRVRFAPLPLGVPDRTPVLALETVDGKVTWTDVDGRPLGSVASKGR